MARPTKEDSIYKVSLHKNGRYMYASTHPYTLDDSGRRKYTVQHWGTVGEGNRFIPGKQYLYASVEERGRLIFPEDWDMSEIGKLPSNRGRGRRAYEGVEANRFYGDVWLLERIADKTGLTADLGVVFDGNREMVQDVLTMAFFPYLTGFNYSRLARWQRIERSPSEREFTPTMITRLTQSITEGQRMDLFKLRAGRLGKDELCAVDSTSRSAWGDSLADIMWGKSKDRLPLPQTLEVVAYSLTSHMPIYYREFPGNIPDSRSVGTILTDLEHAGFPTVTLVTDRGYESLQNLGRYILKGQPMIMCVSVHQKFVIEKIRGFGIIDGRPEGMEMDLDTRLYYKQYDLEYMVEGNGGTSHRADRLKLDLFFNPARRAGETTDMDFEVERQRKGLGEMLASGVRLDDDTTVRHLYNWFDLEYDEDARILKSFKLNGKKVARARAAAGFFAYVTIGVDKTPLEAMSAYGLRDEQEKYFNTMKSQMNFGRQRNWSEEGKSGRLFVMFVGLILASYVRHVWRSTMLKEQFSSSLEVLDEMRPIRCIECKGRMLHITPFVGAQVDICEAFGIDIPDGCAPRYRSRQAQPKHRGRPRKQKIEKPVNISEHWHPAFQ